MPRRWLWGLAFGLLIGMSVVILSAARYGLSGPLVLLGIVLAIGFGALGVVSSFFGPRHSVD